METIERIRGMQKTLVEIGANKTGKIHLVPDGEWGEQSELGIAWAKRTQRTEMYPSLRSKLANRLRMYQFWPAERKVADLAVMDLALEAVATLGRLSVSDRPQQDINITVDPPVYEVPVALQQAFMRDPVEPDAQPFVPGTGPYIPE